MSIIVYRENINILTIHTLRLKELCKNYSEYYLHNSLRRSVYVDQNIVILFYKMDSKTIKIKSVH